MSSDPATGPIIIKLGGNAASGEARDAIAHDIGQLAAQGAPIVVVHGGGPQTSALQRQLGQTPRKVAGRRVTDEPTLDAIKMMVGGKLNIELCAALVAAGARPVGLHGASSLVVEASRRLPRAYPGHAEPVDLGLVGDVTAVNTKLIDSLLRDGHTPVVACIGASAQGEVFNINADVVASRVAIELRASALVLVSDIRGVLRDKTDPDTRIGRLTTAEGNQAIADGVVTEGMIPKLQEAFEAIAQGVSRIHIVGQLEPGELQREVEDPGSVGTTLLP